MLLSLAPKLFCPPALGPRKAGVVLLWGGLQGGRGREAGLGGGGRRAPSEGLGLQDVAEEIRLWNVRCRDRWSRWRLGQELCIGRRWAPEFVVLPLRCIGGELGYETPGRRSIALALRLQILGLGAQVATDDPLLAARIRFRLRGWPDLSSCLA